MDGKAAVENEVIGLFAKIHIIPTHAHSEQLLGHWVEVPADSKELVYGFTLMSKAEAAMFMQQLSEWLQIDFK